MAKRGATTASTFGVDAFWSLIDRVAAGTDLERACEAFRRELDALDDAALVEAEGHFCDAMRRAHDWRLWDAAYIIHGGCSDDAFWDFRAGLVAMGRELYERALANPDSLADVVDVVDRTLFEGFQYVPGDALEARGLTRHGRSQHAKPVGGTSVKDEELAKRFPRLSERFG